MRSAANANGKNYNGRLVIISFHRPVASRNRARVKEMRAFATYNTTTATANQQTCCCGAGRARFKWRESFYYPAGARDRANMRGDKHRSMRQIPRGRSAPKYRKLAKRILSPLVCVFFCVALSMNNIKPFRNARELFFAKHIGLVRNDDRITILLNMYRTGRLVGGRFNYQMGGFSFRVPANRTATKSINHTSCTAVVRTVCMEVREDCTRLCECNALGTIDLVRGKYG